MFDESLDSLHANSLDPWWDADLQHGFDAPEPPDDYRQMAVTGIMLGDTSAVTVLELAHRRQLINASVLSFETLLLPERPLPDGSEFGEVYIDDLVLFSILHMSRLHELRSCPRAARANRVYRQLTMPTSSDKRERRKPNPGVAHWTASLDRSGSHASSNHVDVHHRAVGPFWA